MFDDLRQSFRAAVRHPAFALCTVATLALGIGATTAVFSVVNAALLRPYPHVETDRWAYLYETSSAEGLSLLSVSIPNYRDWRRQAAAFSDMALWFHWSYNLSGLPTGDPERVPAVVITPEVFAALGAPPAAGRWLAPDDGSRSVMIGHGLWQRRFGGDPNVVGRSIELNLVPHLVVGVMPPAFSFPPETRTEVWVPFAARDIAAAEGRDMRGNRVAARLRPGATFEQAQAEMDVVARRLAAQHPEDKGYGARVVPLREGIAGDLRAPLLTLFGALGLVLLLACVSLANLQLTRWESRRKELAVRAVLGAPAWKLGRQVVLESLALALLAGAIGLCLAPAGVRLLLSFVPAEQMPWLAVTIDRTVWVVAAGLTLAVGLLTGGLSALRAMRTDLGQVLATRAGAGPMPPAWADGRARASWSRNWRSRWRRWPERRCSSRASCGSSGWTPASRPNGASRSRSPRRGRDTRSRRRSPRSRRRSAARSASSRASKRRASGRRCRSPPASAGCRPSPGATPRRRKPRRTSPRPLQRRQHELRGGPRRSVEGGPHVRPHRHVRGGARGRDQRDAGAPVLPRRGPARPAGLGRPRAGAGGLAAAHDRRGRRRRAARARWTHRPRRRPGCRWRSSGTAKTPGARCSSWPARAPSRSPWPPKCGGGVASVDPDLALTDVRALHDRLGESVWRQRLAAHVLGALGVVAVLIAVLGVFGIVGFLVGRRTHEMGVRMALGATPRDLVGLVMREGGRLILAGIVLGIGAAVALGRSLSSLLYGVGVNDPATLAATAAALATAALAACYVPARRAGRVTPLTALRDP